jgi:hypothetical protein
LVCLIKKIGDKLVVWLSFNVHGNELREESAMTVAYELVNAANSVSRKELGKTIVIS